MAQFYKIRHVKMLLLLFLAFTLLACTAETATVSSHEISAEATHQYPNDLWQRLRNGFSLEAFEHKEISKNEASYIKTPKYLYRITERSERYLFHIVDEVERRGMPAEIALLPLVESAFNPHAKSSENAVGLWQFIPSTGKSFGLKQDGWLDERQDVMAATHAALDYLQKLHKKFGDWELAIAAYNWGQGAVSRSIAKNRKKGLLEDFHSIKLPIETRNHIHKLIAIKNIVTDPKNYGITLNTIPNTPYFAEIEIHHHMDKALVAELADISIDEFNALNPAYKRAIVKVRNAPRILLLPVENADTYLSNLDEYNEPLMSWKIHQLKKGENIHKISKRFRITEAQLIEVNGITKKSIIAYGQTILTPGDSLRVDADIAIVRHKPMMAKVTENRTIYVVRKGDTLSGIAKHHGTTIRQIKLWNTDDDRIFINQKLIIQQIKS